MIGLCYSSSSPVNQADACQAFALGKSSGRIQQNLREIDSRIIRLFLYDKGAPDPVTEWPMFASYVQAVLNVGAKPMIAERHPFPGEGRNADAGRCGAEQKSGILPAPRS